MKKIVTRAHYANLQEAWDPTQYTKTTSKNYMVPGELRDATVEMAKEIYCMSLDEFIKRTEL